MKIMGLVALGILGWVARCLMKTLETTGQIQQKTVSDLASAFTLTTTQISQAQTELTLTLMAGYPPLSEPSLMSTNESEISNEQEQTLEGMPQHIREAIEREQTEDLERQQMLSSTRLTDLG